jgi:hypothetical protein
MAGVIQDKTPLVESPYLRSLLVCTFPGRSRHPVFLVPSCMPDSQVTHDKDMYTYREALDSTTHLFVSKKTIHKH